MKITSGIASCSLTTVQTGSILKPARCLVRKCHTLYNMHFLFILDFDDIPMLLVCVCVGGGVVCACQGCLVTCFLNVPPACVQQQTRLASVSSASFALCENRTTVLCNVCVDVELKGEAKVIWASGLRLITAQPLDAEHRDTQRTSGSASDTRRVGEGNKWHFWAFGVILLHETKLLHDAETNV